MPRMRSYPSQPVPVPCPTCYSPMKETPEGFACDKHGLVKAKPKPKHRRKAAVRETAAAFAFIVWVMLLGYASVFALEWLMSLIGAEPWSFTPISS